VLARADGSYATLIGGVAQADVMALSECGLSVLEVGQ